MKIYKLCERKNDSCFHFSVCVSLPQEKKKKIPVCSTYTRVYDVIRFLCTFYCRLIICISIDPYSRVYKTGASDHRLSYTVVYNHCPPGIYRITSWCCDIISRRIEKLLNNFGIYLFLSALLPDKPLRPSYSTIQNGAKMSRLRKYETDRRRSDKQTYTYLRNMTIIKKIYIYISINIVEFYYNIITYECYYKI